MVTLISQTIFTFFITLSTLGADHPNPATNAAAAPAGAGVDPHHMTLPHTQPHQSTIISIHPLTPPHTHHPSLPHFPTTPPPSSQPPQPLFLSPPLTPSIVAQVIFWLFIEWHISPPSASAQRDLVPLLVKVTTLPPTQLNLIYLIPTITITFL